MQKMVSKTQYGEKKMSERVWTKLVTDKNKAKHGDPMCELKANPNTRDSHSSISVSGVPEIDSATPIYEVTHWLCRILYYLLIGI